MTNKHKQPSIALLGNQDGLLLYLLDAFNLGHYNLSLYTLADKKSDIRSKIDFDLPTELTENIVDLELTLFTTCFLPKKLKKELETFDLVLFSGAKATLIAAQLNCPTCYFPVGAHELTKFEKVTAPVSIRNLLRLTVKLSEKNLIVDLIYAIIIRRLYIKLMNNLTSILSRNNDDPVPVYTKLCEQHFRSSKYLSYPDPVIRMGFIRENYSSVKYQALAKEYHNFDLVFLVPSRKWIVPDPHTGYTKRTDWILTALENIFSSQNQSNLNIKVVWFDHGQDADYCRQQIERSSWSDYVDFVAQQTPANLWAYFRLDNAIVLDQFGEQCWPVMGGAMRESLAMGKTVFCSNFDPELAINKSKFGSVPIEYCSDEATLQRKLQAYIANPKIKLQETKTKAQSWEVKAGLESKLLNTLNRIVDQSLD